ncbi:T6SS effector BTH_I2691 family protein, partial [Enterobacter hormaechei]
ASFFENGYNFSALCTTLLSSDKEYYHESTRAEFASGYQSIVDCYQQKLKSVVQDLSASYQSVFWHTVIEHDYAPEVSVISWAALLSTLAGNLHGGMVGMDKSDKATDGGRTVWLSWMQDPKSPPYRALLAGRKDLTTSVYDGTMTYANLKTLLNSDEMGHFLNSDAFRQTTASLVMSLNGAFSQLSSVLSEKAEAGFVRTMSALACAAGEGPMVAVYSGEMTIRDYQNVVRKPLNAYGQSVLTQRLENIDSIISASRAGHWPEITDPVILDLKIQVKLAAPLKTMDSLMFKQAARKAGTSVSAIKSGRLLKNTGQLAGLPDLTPEIVSHSLTTGKIPLSAADMRRVAGFQSELPPSFYAGSLGVVLAGVMLGFQIHTMHENMKSLKTRLPDSQSVMSLSSGTLLMMATGAEIVGQTYTIFQASKEMVHPMLKVAGVIGGVAVVIDGVSLLMKSCDVRAAGDTTAADFYKAAGFVSIVAGGVGIAFGIAGNFALFSEALILGPVGWCIALGLVALILASAADSNVRSPLERWLTHTCFGVVEKRGGKEKAWSAASLSDLQDAMNELHTIASGVSAQLVRDRITEFLSSTTLSGTEMVSVLATLPDCSQSGSDWLVELTAVGNGGREVLARNGSPTKLAGLDKPVPQTYEVSYVMSMVADAVPPAIKMTSAPELDETLITAGTSKMLQLSGEYPLNTRRFTGMELKVTYWPDKKNPEEILQLSATMDSQ